MIRDDEIFGEALDLIGAERSTFLDRACAGDAALRARVEALLAGHDAAGAFLGQAAVERPQPTLPEEKPGDVIGRYTLLKKIGEGGCGVVYLAEQTEPVRRRVALKVIKLGMDTRQVIARFEAERQALALMDHPDIARVFDAGATAAGRPFFVMEYVDGVPITQFCDEHSLPMTTRLELFARVCVALQHAHQKGIIHRDVKPSNILVGQQDSQPAPKIIDFGIAKATQGRLTEATLVTGFDQFIGTPAYMSPEQAELRELEIDTRSDIYSLGVLLYELLTGRPPFDPKSLIRAGVEEIRRIIREVEPARPSTAVSTLADADRTVVAHQRCAAPARLTSALRGDLDWIVMRCLEKDRGRRYDTAHELADDIRRHLRSEPVTACPPSALYRSQKFVARHRVACIAVAAVAASLVLGTVVSVRQAIRATHAEHDAQRRQEQAEALLTFMLGDFRAERKKAGKLSLLDDVGEKALAYFAALEPRDLTDTVLTRQIKALRQIGETRMDQARFAEADVAFLAAYTRASALTTRHQRDGEMLFERAQVEYWLGVEHRKKGDMPGANRWLTTYRDSALQLVALDPANPAWQEELGYGHHNLAVLDMDRSNYDGARTGFLAELDILSRTSAAKPNGGDATLRFNLANLYSWLGSAAERSGDFPEARVRYDEQVRRIEALVTAEPGTARWRVRVAEALTFTSDLAAVSDRRAEALIEIRRSRSLIDPLCEQDPANRAWQRLSLFKRLKEAELLHADGNLGEATRLANDVHSGIEKLVQAEASSTEFTITQLQCWRLEAELHAARREPNATIMATKAVELGEKLLATDSSLNNKALTFVLRTSAAAAAIHRSAGDSVTAEARWQRVASLAGPHLEKSRDWRLLDPAARALAGLGRVDEARTLVARLATLGYRPLSPWPEALRP